MATTPKASPAAQRLDPGSDANPKRELELLGWRHELLARSTLDLVLLLDDEQRVVDANHPALELLGYRPDELARFPLSELQDPAD